MKKILINDDIYLCDGDAHSVYIAFDGEQKINKELILTMDNGFSIHMLVNKFSDKVGELDYTINSEHLFYEPFLNFLGNDSSIMLCDNNYGYEKRLLINHEDNVIKLNFNSDKNQSLVDGLIRIEDNDSNIDLMTRFNRLFSDLYILSEIYGESESIEEAKVLIRK